MVARREGRVVRYALGDAILRDLLDRVHPDPDLNHLTGDAVFRPSAPGEAGGPGKGPAAALTWTCPAA